MEIALDLDGAAVEGAAAEVVEASEPAMAQVEEVGDTGDTMNTETMGDITTEDSSSVQEDC